MHTAPPPPTPALNWSVRLVSCGQWRTHQEEGSLLSGLAGELVQSSFLDESPSRSNQRLVVVLKGPLDGKQLTQPLLHGGR